jgi:hypothetical protein
MTRKIYSSFETTSVGQDCNYILTYNVDMDFGTKFHDYVWNTVYLTRQLVKGCFLLDKGSFPDRWSILEAEALYEA